MDMININEMIRFQTERNLHLKEYVWVNESVNIIEELFEAGGLKIPPEKRNDLKTLFESMIYQAHNLGIAIEDPYFVEGASEVDAYADIMEFCTGAIMKKKYDPNITLDEMAKEINSRVGTFIDGKFQKDTRPEIVKNYYKADYNKGRIK